MWLLSFAWRNRNLKQKQKGRGEGSGENKCRPTLQSITLPSAQASLTRTTSIYAWRTLPLQRANCLLKCTRRKTDTTQLFLRSGALLAGLHNTPRSSHSAPFTWYAPCMLLTPLWSCSQGYGAMIILALANPPPRLWTACCRLQELRSYSSSNQPQPRSHSDSASECLISC